MGSMDDGRVEGIYMGAEPGVMPGSMDEVKAFEGVGLKGDRYAVGAGSQSVKPGTGRHLTLIEREALEDLAASGITLSPGESRRNLETRGVDLNALIGKRFMVGEVECEGMRECAPCAHLEGITQPGVLSGLRGRGGLRAEIRSNGTIRVGDAIAALD